MTTNKPQTVQELHEILRKAQQQCANGKRRDGLSDLLDVLDDLVGTTDYLMGRLGRITPERFARDFELVNTFMRELDAAKIHELDTVLLITMLTGTRRGEALPERAAFFDRVKAEETARNPDKVDRLLQGLADLTDDPGF